MSVEYDVILNVTHCHPLARRRQCPWGSRRPPGKLQNFITYHYLIVIAVEWQEYCRCGAKHKRINQVKPLVCFVCLSEFFVPLGNFLLIMRRHHYMYRGRAARFNLHSALKGQWGVFSVPHLLWHGTYVCNGYLRQSVTLTTSAGRLAVELSLSVLMR